MIPTDFHFERPLWFLALVPAAVVLWHAVRAAGQGSAWRDAVDAHLLRHLALPADGGRESWPFWLLGVGWLSAVLAMAGPSWERVPQPTTQTLEPIVVALDMSASMDGQDVTPSRLARARYKLQDVLARNAGGQVGLVIYSDEPFVASPLTDDARVIGEMVPTLTSDIMPGRGSRPDRAIEQSVALLEQAGVPGGRIVLFTDSAGDDPAATRAAAARAAASGRVVSVLGVGTEEGTSLPDGRGGLARTAAGEIFLARLPTDELETVAAAGDGRFARVTAGEADLNVLVAQSLSATEVDESTLRSADVEIWKDAGIYLLFLPVLLAPFAFRRGWLAAALLVLALGAPQPARASLWEDLWKTRDQQGAAALEAGDAAAASDLFESPEWRAAADYEEGDYESAEAQFAALDGHTNRYNLGNSLARTGALEEAIAAYDEVLAVTPDHEDAKFNRDLVEELLKQQQQQEQQQQEQQQSADSEGSEQDQQQQSQSESGDGDESEQNDSGDSSQESASSSPGEGSEQEDAGSEQASAENAGEDGTDDASGTDQQAGSADSEESSERHSSQARSGTPGEESEPSQEKYAQHQEPEEGDGSNSLSEPMNEALDGEPPGEEAPQPGSQMAAAGPSEPMTEERQAHEQMLRQIPDDPAGLLRAKIHRKYAEKRFARQQRQLVQQGGTNPWW